MELLNRAVLSGEKKTVPLHSFPKKARGHTMRWWLAVGGCRLATGGWWRLAAVGGWVLVVDGGWQWLAVGGWPLVAAGGWRWLAVGGWWRLVAVGGWRLMDPWGGP